MSTNYPVPYNHITPFVWNQRFALYLGSKRSDICPIDAWKLGWDYVTMLSNLIRISPYEVVEEVLSEQDVLYDFWEHYYQNMVHAGKCDGISSKDCIDMWCMINWAVEVTEEVYNEY